MTFEQARAAIGARVTHQSTGRAGVIRNVTQNYVWVQYDGDKWAVPVYPEHLTLADEAAAG